MYNQDLDTYDATVIVAGNNNYDANITKEQAKTEIKEQLKMVEKVTEDFLKQEDKEITLVQPFPMPAKESVSNIRESVVMRGCKKGNVEITREMNLTKDDFTADGIHPNLNGTSIIMQKISSHRPGCFISTCLLFVAEREYSSVKVEYKYGCKVCCKDHHTADCDKLKDQKTAKRRGERSNIVLSPLENDNKQHKGNDQRDDNYRR